MRAHRNLHGHRSCSAWSTLLRTSSCRRRCIERCSSRKVPDAGHLPASGKSSNSGCAGGIHAETPRLDPHGCRRWLLCDCDNLTRRNPFEQGCTDPFCARPRQSVAPKSVAPIVTRQRRDSTHHCAVLRRVTLRAYTLLLRTLERAQWSSRRCAESAPLRAPAALAVTSWRTGCVALSRTPITSRYNVSRNAPCAPCHSPEMAACAAGSSPWSSAAGA